MSMKKIKNIKIKNDNVTHLLPSQVILAEKNFANADRLNVNLGNLYFRRREFTTALKHYRKALDRVPPAHKRTQCKILNNIGVAQVKLGRYDAARDNFAECLKLEGEYVTALNLVLACYCLEDAEGMKDAFQRLVDIPTLVDDDVKQDAAADILAQQAMSDDMLRR